MEQVLGFKTASVVGVPCLSAASVWKIAVFAASRWQKTTARRDLEPAVQQLAGEGSDAVQLLAPQPGSDGYSGIHLPPTDRVDVETYCCELIKSISFA
jgi:hypothetical protein